MKEETKKLIHEIAIFIDKDKYNPLLTSRDYDKYLEKVLTELAKGIVNIEGKE